MSPSTAGIPSTTATLHLRMHPSLKEATREAAKARGVSMSRYVEQLLLGTEEPPGTRQPPRRLPPMPPIPRLAELTIINVNDVKALATGGAVDEL